MAFKLSQDNIELFYSLRNLVTAVTLQPKNSSMLTKDFYLIKKLEAIMEIVIF
jgi:hypothetical protein